MRPYFYLLSASLGFATIGVLVKSIGNSMNIMSLNFFRVLFAFIMLLILCPRLDRNIFQVTKKDLRLYAIIGFLIAVGISTYNAAIILSTISNTVILTYTYPFFVLLISSILLKEQIRKFEIVSILGAFLGIVIINPFSSIHVIGNLLAIISAINFAILISLIRYESRVYTPGKALFSFLFASLFLVPFPFIFGTEGFMENLVYIIPLGMFSTALAHVFMIYALEKIETKVVSILDTITTPVLSIILAYIIIGETLTPNILVGGSILILSGVWLFSMKRRIKRPITRPV